MTISLPFGCTLPGSIALRPQPRGPQAVEDTLKSLYRAFRIAVGQSIFWMPQWNTAAQSFRQNPQFFRRARKRVGTVKISWHFVLRFIIPDAVANRLNDRIRHVLPPLQDKRHVPKTLDKERVASDAPPRDAEYRGQSTFCQTISLFRERRSHMIPLGHPRRGSATPNSKQAQDCEGRMRPRHVLMRSVPTPCGAYRLGAKHAASHATRDALRHGIVVFSTRPTKKN